MSIDSLQEEKLKLEINDLKRHWATKPQYLQVLLPTTLAIFSLLFAITSGLFSSKQELLELNRKRLETDISTFQKQKESLTKTIISLNEQINKKNDSLEDRNLILKKYEASFTKERLIIEGLNAEVTYLKNTKNEFNVDIAALEKEYNTKKQSYLKEIESKYYKEIDFDKKVKEQQTSINNLKDEIIDLKYKVNLLETNPFIKANSQNEFKNWYFDKLDEYLKSKILKRKNEMERLQRDIEKNKKSMDTLNVHRKVLKIK